jgi:hypothetical protein
MSAEGNKATLLRAIAELKEGSLAIIDEVFSPTFTFYYPLAPHWPRGLAGARKMDTQLRALIPDVQVTVEDIFAEGDKVAARYTFRGTYHREAQPGAPNPGEPITITSISMYRFANGKIEEDWGVDGLWQTGEAWKNTAE